MGARERERISVRFIAMFFSFQTTFCLTIESKYIVRHASKRLNNIEQREMETKYLLCVYLIGYCFWASLCVRARSRGHSRAIVLARASCYRNFRCQLLFIELSTIFMIYGMLVCVCVFALSAGATLTCTYIEHIYVFNASVGFVRYRLLSHTLNQYCVSFRFPFDK